mgnify:CR=1 FL=1
MDEQFDTGAIIESVKFPIDKKIINKDLVQITHEKLSVLRITAPTTLISLYFSHRYCSAFLDESVSFMYILQHTVHCMVSSELRSVIM